MARMSEATIAALRAAVVDPTVVARYWRHIQPHSLHGCWHWTGAISGRGHGRFQLADDYDAQRRRSTRVVIAHRFGYALAHGVDVLLSVPIVAHTCDNPLCQQPTHWRAADARSNRREWAARRGEAGPLADRRGARGRARELRDALLHGGDADAVAVDGLPVLYRNQTSLLPGLERRFSDAPVPPPVPRRDGEPQGGDDQPSLFD